MTREQTSVPEHEAYIRERAEKTPKLARKGRFAARVAVRRSGVISVYNFNFNLINYIFK